MTPVRFEYPATELPAGPRVVLAADPFETMHDQLDALKMHERDGKQCGCRSDEVHANTCDRLNWIRALLLEPFSEPKQQHARAT